MADKLIPKDHGFGTRRVPLESGYFETYNRDNVTLIDTLVDEPIECITPHGIKTTKQEHEFDILIYATGFDGVTGAYDRIDIRGENGLRPKLSAQVGIPIRDHVDPFRPACGGRTT